MILGEIRAYFLQIFKFWTCDFCWPPYLIDGLSVSHDVAQSDEHISEEDARLVGFFYKILILGEIRA